MGQNFSWLEWIGHKLEQQGPRRQRAGNLRNAVRRLCVKIECKWFCKPIKGQSETTRTQFCQLIHKNHTYWGKNLDWYWTTRIFALRLFSVEVLGKSLFYCVHVQTRCAFLGTLEPARVCWKTCQVHTIALRRKTNCDKGNEWCMIVTVLLEWILIRRNWSIFFVMVVYLEKMMERLNSGE